jgi:hypothetical protein
MSLLQETRAQSKALDLPYFHRLPAIPAEQIALAWLTSRYRFSSPELAAAIAALAFHNGGRQ